MQGGIWNNTHGECGERKVKERRGVGEEVDKFEECANEPFILQDKHERSVDPPTLKENTDMNACEGPYTK